jgi:hypothetical protein
MDGNIHHLVRATKNDGSTVEGHLQPYDHVPDTIVYLTPDSGVGETAKLHISEIRSIEVLN